MCGNRVSVTSLFHRKLAAVSIDQAAWFLLEQFCATAIYGSVLGSMETYRVHIRTSG